MVVFTEKQKEYLELADMSFSGGAKPPWPDVTQWRPPTVTVLHIMGATCSGKSTLISELAKYPQVGAVQIGKALRAKYGESYFKGQGAPAHTAVEAMSIYKDEVNRHVAEGKTLIVVDGQPRDVDQAQEMMEAWPEFAVGFYSLFANHEVRELRAKFNRQGDDLDLTLARLNNDYKDCYLVCMKLLESGEHIVVVDTGAEDFDVEALAASIAEDYGLDGTGFLQ